MPVCASILNLLSQVTVEPVLFLYMLASFLQFPSFQALVYQKVCADHYNSSLCLSLDSDNFTSERRLVQGSSSSWIMYNNMAFTLPSVVTVTFFLGPWGDRVGRKMPLILSTIGSMVYSLCNLLVSRYPDSKLSYLLIGNIVNGLSGGYIAMMMSVYSYIGHISTAKHKTSRISITESMIFLAGTFGVLVSGVLLDHLSFVGVFIIILSIQTLALIYTVIMVPNIFSSMLRDAEGGDNTAFCSYLLASVKDSVICVKKPRKTRVTGYLGLQIMVIVILMMCTSGENDILYLYTKLPDFDWSSTTYGLYKSGENFTRGLAVLTLLPMLRYLFSIRDTVLALMGLFSKVAGLIILGVAAKTWQIYIVAIIGILQGFPSAGLRSLMSSMVARSEQGKLFGLVASAESLASLVATVIFNNIYTSTLTLYQGFSFLLAAALTVVALLIVSVLHCGIYHSGIQYENFIDEDDEEGNIQNNTGETEHEHLNTEDNDGNNEEEDDAEIRC